MKTSKKSTGKKTSRKRVTLNPANPYHVMMILSIITCGEDCDFDLPAVLFADCDPETNESQIVKIYEAKANAADLSDWSDPAAWAARLDQSSTDPDAIREYTVIGDKPKPEATKRKISGGRTVITGKKHVVNFDVDESNATNHDAVRGHKCIDQVKFWYQTKSGHLFGGNSGITASMEIDMVLGRAEDDIIIYPGSMAWDSRDLEERIVSPIAA
jgi:hypothetical protein